MNNNNNNNNNIIRNPVIKVVFVGTNSVGKSSLINTYFDQPFDEYIYSTLYADYRIKKLSVENKTYTIRVHDTAGSDRLRNILRLTIRYSKIIVLVFDMTKKNSILELERILDIILDEMGTKFSLVLVGNKTDLYDKYEIKEKEAEELAKALKAPFILSSAKNNSEGFKRFFDNFLEDYIIQHREELENAGQRVLRLNNQNRNRRNRGFFC